MGQHKIQAQAGMSLADVYDVKGSQISVDRLESTDVQLVHDMSTTVFSERFSGEIVRFTSGAIAASTVFDTVLTGVELPATPSRVHGIFVHTSITSRLSFVSVCLLDANAGRDIPAWMWNGADEDNVRIRDNGGAAGTVIALRPFPEYALMPNMVTGVDQPVQVAGVALRGQTSAFGAGTVTVTARIHFSFAQLEGVSSLGLAIPSW